MLNQFGKKADGPADSQSEDRGKSGSVNPGQEKLVRSSPEIPDFLPLAGDLPDLSEVHRQVTADIDKFISGNFLQAHFAEKRILKEVDLEAAFALAEQYEQIPNSRHQKANMLFHAITRHNNQPHPTVLGYSDFQSRRAARLDLVINIAFPMAKANFPRVPLQIYDIGASSGMLAEVTYQCLQSNWGVYHVTDIVVEFLVLRHHSGASAVFSPERSAPLQMKSLAGLHRRARETDGLENLAAADEGLAESFIGAHNTVNKTGAAPDGFEVKRYSAFCPAVEHPDTNRRLSLVSDRLDVFDNRPDADHAHLSIVGSLIEPGYLSYDQMKDALRTLGRNTKDGGIILIVNEHGEYVGGQHYGTSNRLTLTHPYSIFERQGDSLQLRHFSRSDMSAGWRYLGFNRSSPGFDNKFLNSLSLA